VVLSQATSYFGSLCFVGNEEALRGSTLLVRTVIVMIQQLNCWIIK